VAMGSLEDVRACISDTSSGDTIFLPAEAHR
jgi:hypothetical protein